LEAYIHAKSENTRDMRKVTSQIKELVAETNTTSGLFYLCYAHAELSEFDEAFDYIASAIDSRSLDVLSILVDPRLSKLRNDVRFSKYVDKIGIIAKNKKTQAT